MVLFNERTPRRITAGGNGAGSVAGGLDRAKPSAGRLGET
jgi:hypothetical protein